MSDGFSETHTGKADFDDVSESTFERFCQFAYTGSYATPVHTIDNSVSNSVVQSSAVHPPSDLTNDLPVAMEKEEHFVPPRPGIIMTNSRTSIPEELDDDLVFGPQTNMVNLTPNNSRWLNRPGKTSQYPNPSLAADSFNERVPSSDRYHVNVRTRQAANGINVSDYPQQPPAEEPATQPPNKPIPNIRQTQLRNSAFNDLAASYQPDDKKWSSPCLIRPNKAASEDYTSIFLAHAELYVFGDKYCIETLKLLVLLKLHQTLSSFHLYAERCKDVVELVRCVYDGDHTRDRDIGEEGKSDALRELVLWFAVMKSEELLKCSAFKGLIGEGGEFAQVMMKALAKKCCDYK
jgi:hypothetical protein